MKRKSKQVNSSGLKDAQMPMLKIKEIKILLKTGEISYEKAKEMTEKPLQEMQKRMAEISKKFGFKPQKIFLANLLR